MKKIIKRIRQKLKYFLFGNWITSQQIPITYLNNTAFIYKLNFTGSDETYAPEVEQSNPVLLTSQLKLHLHFQTIPRPYHFFVNDAVVSNTFIFDSKNPSVFFHEALPEYSIFSRGKGAPVNIRDIIKSRIRSRNPDPGFEKAYLFSNSWWGNYYHFVTDSLLKFHALKSQKKLITDDTKLILHSKPNRWQKEYLDLMGITDQSIEYSNHHPIKIRNLLIGSPRRYRYYCSANSANSFRDFFLDTLEVPKDTTNLRLYVSRGDSANRKIKNEEELIDQLIKRDFVILELDKLSVAEQIRYFSNAKLIVAPHGAGLTNTIFCEKPVVIEIFPRDAWYYGHFLALTNAMGGIHIPIIGEVLESIDELKVKSYRVDVATILKYVDQL